MDTRNTTLSVRFFPKDDDDPFVETDLRSLNGALLLGRRGQLHFTTRLVFKAGDIYRKERSVIRLWADMRVSGQDNVPLPELGRAAIPDPVVFQPVEPSGYGGPRYDPWTRAHDRLILDLDFWQLDEIERKRHGGSLTFTFTFGGIAYHGGKVGILHPDNHTVTYQVGASDWQQVLNQLVYGTFVTVEIPLTSTNGLTGDMQKAARALHEAQAALRRGEYEEAVADCRPGVEALNTADKGKFSLKFGDHAADKDERFYWLQAALLPVVNQAHHPDDAATVGAEVRARWTRADAEAAIGVLAALMRRRLSV